MNINNEGVVVGQIMGGLGNQLFIIFTTISYALENNSKYYIKNIEKVRKTYFDTLIYKNLPIFDNFKILKHYNELDHGYNKIPKYQNLILKGYFQSYKYFENNKDKIIEILGWNKIITDLKIKYNYYLKFDGFIHFRLGDYKNTECHPVCSIEYYKKTLPLLTGNIKILYFFEEEDREEINKKIKILTENFNNITFEAIDTKIVDYEQIFIMSFLKYCVIANSTFSWWGAYLNQREDKEVFYPSTWFTGSLNNLKVDDKCPSSWREIIF